MNTPIKRPGEDTQRPKILAAALDEAAAVGFSHITRDNVAARAGVTSSLIHHYFGKHDDVTGLSGMERFRHEVMVEAVRVANLTVIAQGLVVRHKAALAAPDLLRDRAATSLTAA